MPIYAYKCSSCQHELDVLQKVSDAALRVCPRCGATTLSKQLTAAGFQLKGSGWYVTDFKNAAAKDAKPASKSDDAKPAKGGTTPPKDSEPAKTTAPASGSGSAGDCSVGS